MTTAYREIFHRIGRQTDVLAGCGLTLLAVIANIYFSFRAGALWRDEVHSVNMAAAESWSELWARIGLDTHPIFYSCVLRFWTFIGLGSHDSTLRLLGLLIGIALIASLWAYARWIEAQVPLIALAMVALNPVVIRYTDSLRSYGMGACLAVLLAGLMWLVARSPSRRLAIIAGIVAVMNVQTTYQGAGIVLASCLAASLTAALRKRSIAALTPLAIGGIAALSLLPYLPKFRQAFDWQMVVKSPPGKTEIGKAFYQISSGGMTGISILWVILLLAAATIAIVTIVRGFAPRWRRNASAMAVDRAVYLLTFAIIAGSSLMLVVTVGGLHVNPWHLLTLAVIAGIVIDGQITSLFIENPVSGAAKIAFGLTLAVIVSPGLFSALSVRQTNIDILARGLEANERDGDLIIVAPWFYGMTFNRYYHGKSEWFTIPQLDDYRFVRYDLLKKEMTEQTHIAPAVERVKRAIAEGRRIWIVGGLTSPPPQRIPLPLSPPPHPWLGWDLGRYTMVWEGEIVDILQQGAVDVQTISVPDDIRTQLLEDVQMRLVITRAQ